MKKLILALIVGIFATGIVNAQVVVPAAPAASTVIVQRTPGLIESIVDAAAAIVTAPVVFGSAVVSGVEEVFAPAVYGTTRTTTIVPGYGTPIVPVPPVVPAAPIVTAPVAPVVPAAPVVTTPVVPAAPVVTTPAVVAPTVVSPGYGYGYGYVPSVSTTTISRQTVSPAGAVTVQSYVRPSTAFEISGVPSIPVPIERRVGTAPYVNPYIYRHR